MYNTYCHFPTRAYIIGRGRPNTRGKSYELLVISTSEFWHDLELGQFSAWVWISVYFLMPTAETYIVEYTNKIQQNLGCSRTHGPEWRACG